MRSRNSVGLTSGLRNLLQHILPLCILISIVQLTSWSNSVWWRRRWVLQSYRYCTNVLMDFSSKGRQPGCRPEINLKLTSVLSYTKWATQNGDVWTVLNSTCQEFNFINFSGLNLTRGYSHNLKNREEGGFLCCGFCKLYCQVHMIDL